MQYIEDLVAKQQWPGALQEDAGQSIVFKFQSKTGYDLLKTGDVRQGVYVDTTGNNIPISIPGIIVEGGGFQLRFNKIH